VVAHWDISNGDLRFVRAADALGTSWDTPVIVESAGTVGRFASMTVVDGQPGIAHFDETNGDLKFARPAMPASFTVDWIALEP
jgi:hypothetical protein